MPDTPDSLPEDPIQLISQKIYQAILQVRDRDCRTLRSQYANYRWENEEVKGQIEAWMLKVLGTDGDAEVLIANVMKVLNYFMNSSFFISPAFLELMRDIRQFLEPQMLQIQESAVSQTQANRVEEKGISILLLDAENLHLTPEIETFLTEVCTYPLQIKIAFGNWRNLGKKDAEFHNRGYELIHVPAGKDSADVKMATVGSSIFVHYPNAEEVFVCSSDAVLTHLCNTLQTHGLNVYLVRQKGENIVVVNAKNGQTKTYAIAETVKPVSATELIQQLKQIVRNEQFQTRQHWIKLTDLSDSYFQKYKVKIDKVIDTVFPNKTLKEVLAEKINDFALHNTPNDGQTYVTVFEQQLQPNNSAAKTIEINSQELLQKILVSMVQKLAAKSPSRFVRMSVLSTTFNTEYGQSITQVMKKLGLGSSFTKLLQGYKNLDVKKVGNEYQVAALKQ